VPARTAPAGRADASIASRFRRLRETRGLSQAQLAGGDFTPGYISQVESGRSRLSLHAAQVFAPRLGVSLDELLGTAIVDKQIQIQLIQAERELADGSPEYALKLARGIHGAGPVNGRVLRLQGRALLALDQARDAIPMLERSLDAFRAEQDNEFAVRNQLDLAFAHARLARPQQALVYALECERALKSGSIVDRTFELQVESYLAALYAGIGERESAEPHLERAVALSQDVVDHDALAALYARLAATAQESGELQRAIEYWNRSIKELEFRGRERSVADSWHNIGTAYLRLGEVGKANNALDRAERLNEETKHPTLGPWIRLTRAKLSLRSGRLSEADAMAASAAKDQAASKLAGSEALLVRAEVSDRRKADTGELRQAFNRALEALSGEPPTLRVRAHRLYADALAGRGDFRGALEQSRRALDLLRPLP